METNANTETQKRRREDHLPAAKIDWTRPGAPTIPVAPSTAPLRALASLRVDAEGVSVFATKAAEELEHGHYMLWAPGGQPQAARPSVKPWQERAKDARALGAHADDERPFMRAEIDDLRAAIAREAQPTDRDAARFERMFMEACADLGAINEELGLDPDDGGAGPIIAAIRALKSSGVLRTGEGADRG